MTPPTHPPYDPDDAARHDLRRVDGDDLADLGAAYPGAYPPGTWWPVTEMDAGYLPRVEGANHDD